MKKWTVEDVMNTAVVAVPVDTPYRTGRGGRPASWTTRT
jgi:hypothetical protein